MQASPNKGLIQTVVGTISPDELGRTLMHEHIICDVTKPFYLPPETDEERELAEQPLSLKNIYWVSYHTRKSKPNLLLDSIDTAIEEISQFAKAGGQTIVEVTPVGY